MEACHFSLQPVKLLKEINVSSRIIKIIRYFQLAPYTLPVTPASPLSFVFDCKLEFQGTMYGGINV